MTISEAQRIGQNKLRASGIESHHIDTSLLLEKATGKPRSWLFAHPEESLADTQAREFVELVGRRAQRTPLVHLTNSREFYGLDLYINEDVLTPRVETEKIVEYAITYAPKNSRLIDVGTGSGALAIAIKKRRSDLEVWATDVTDESLAVAHKNATTHQVTIEFIKSDLFEHIDGHFDTVVTNLPYLRDDAHAELMPEVKKEPAVALFGGADGLDLYRRFLQQLPAHLTAGGYLFTECDPWQHDSLIAAAAKMGLEPIEQTNYFILGFRRRD